MPYAPQSEVETGYLQTQADEYGYILFACNWWGMDSNDVPAIVEMMALNLSNFRIIPDRLHQGMLNALSLMRLMKVSCECPCLLLFIEIESCNVVCNVVCICVQWVRLLPWGSLICMYLALLCTLIRTPQVIPAASSLIQTSLSKDPHLVFNGRQVVDTANVHYYGNSLGGIMGDVYMAATTDVIRGELSLSAGIR